MRKPSLYGIDLILLPKQMRGKKVYEQGKCVELNGIQSGASFFLYGNKDYYYRVMKEVKEMVGDKPVLMDHSPSWDIKRKRPEDVESADSRLHQRQTQNAKEWIQHLESTSNTFIHFSDQYLDRVLRDHEKRDKFETHTRSLYKLAAKDLGVKVISAADMLTWKGITQFQKMEFTPEFESSLDRSKLWEGKPALEVDYEFNIPFTHEQGTLCADQIGLIWASTNYYAQNTIGRHRIMNSYLSEVVMHDKALMHFYSDLLPKKHQIIQKFFPKTFLVGPAMYTQNDFFSWLENNCHETYVVKPLTESQGIGVTFMPMKEVIAKFNRPIQSTSRPVLEKAYLKFTLDHLLSASGVVSGSKIIQEVVPSMQVYNPTIDAKNGACARVIVMNGKTMGAGWRSSTKIDGTLSERLRHNICDGASMLPVEQEDYRLLSEIAETIVYHFESGLNQVNNLVTQYNSSHIIKGTEKERNDLPAMVLNETLYMRKMKQSAVQSGINVPSLLRKWLKENNAKDNTLEYVNTFIEFYKKL